MKPGPFAYHRAASIDDAIDVLATCHGKVLAGGQSLIPIMSMRLASPSDLVDLNHIPGLDVVEVGDAGITIGALVRHRQLELDDAAYAAQPLLRRALSNVAHPTIRNRGTTLGSLVHADPAAEMPAVLMLLDGTVDVVSKARGARTIGAGDFFLGPLESALEADEVAVSATFQRQPDRTGSSWLEVARRHGDYALVGVGATITLTEEGAVTRAALALISVGATPIVVDLTPALDGADPAQPDLDAVNELVSTVIDPETDIHATAEYRAQLVRVLSGRAIAAAAKQAKQWRAA